MSSDMTWRPDSTVGGVPAGGRPQILVLNVGSSSVKYRLFDAARLTPGCGGVLERVDLTDPGSAAETLRSALAEDSGLRGRRITAFGHRVVHGGTRHTRPALVDDAVLNALRSLTPLAPLHLPANIAGIEAARRLYPDAAHVAVFDTGFHRTLPPAAYTYAVPAQWREHLGVRRYGFHGISYAHVTRRAAALLGRDRSETNLIALHLGNGASACAVRAGLSVDTSMGMTPLEGLVMGTRSGDVDPALAGYLARVAGLDVHAVEDALNRDSGLKALAGSNDLRDVWASADAGDRDARAALDVYCHRIRKYVGAYLAVLGEVHAIVFTGGVGEHDAGVRAASLCGLEGFGISIDPDRNEAGGGSGGERLISRREARIPVLVVPADEELEIARCVTRVALRRKPALPERGTPVARGHRGA